MSRRIIVAAPLAAASFACEGSPRTGSADEAPPVIGRIEGLAMPFEGAKVHGSSMPSWGVMLTAEQTWDLVAYVASFQRERLTPPGE